MIQLIIIGIFVLLVAHDSEGCDELNIICSTVCVHDGNDKGIVIQGKCYCADYRPLDKIIARVPKQGGLVAEKKKSTFWD